MNTEDIMILVHPSLSPEQHTKIEEAMNTYEEAMNTYEGIVSVHFNSKYTHELTVTYASEVVDSQRILQQVRHWDKEAMAVGL